MTNITKAYERFINKQVSQLKDFIELQSHVNRTNEIITALTKTFPTAKPELVRLQGEITEILRLIQNLNDLKGEGQ